MRKFVLTALAFVALASTASAQTVQASYKMIDEVFAQGSRVCPKAVMPQICRLEFGAVQAKVGQVLAASGDIGLAISRDDQLAEDWHRIRKAKLLEEVSVDLQKLVDKYGD